MDLNPGIKLGWSPLHDACFKGKTEVIQKLLNYARDTGKNLIELETNDDYKTTPLIIAALGGRHDIVSLLIENGANLNATITVQDNRIPLKIFDVAAIRKDIDLLVYLYERIPNISHSLRQLFISMKIEDGSRETVAQVIEFFSLEYYRMNQGIAKVDLAKATPMQRMAYEIITHVDFGKCLVKYLELCEGNINCFISFVQIFFNVVDDDVIRGQFSKHNGIEILTLKFINVQTDLLIERINSVEEIQMAKTRTQLKAKMPLTVTWKDLQMLKDTSKKFDQELDDFFKPNLIESTWCVCIGKTIGALSTFDDSLETMNDIDNGFNEKIIKYIQHLFEWNKMTRTYEAHVSRQTPAAIVTAAASVKVEADKKGKPQRMESVTSTLVEDKPSDIPVLFDQYIHPFIICMGNLAFKSVVSKSCFNSSNLMDNILSFWSHIKETKPGMKVLTQTLTSVQCDNIPKIFDELSPKLTKNLKLGIIEAIGKTLNKNDSLKQLYMYSYSEGYDVDEQKSEFKKADWFIKELIKWIDASVLSGREYQFESLKFIKLITEQDPTMQNILVRYNGNIVDSSLINSLKNLIKKNSPRNLRFTALFIIWTLSGEDDEAQEFHDRKCAIYRLINPEELIDLLFETENEIILICLEALLSILTSPPYRNTNNELVNTQDELAKIHVIPGILRLLKSSVANKQIKRMSLRVIEALCISYGYKHNSNNQSLFSTQGGLTILLDFIRKEESSSEFKCHVYYTLSMICFSNSKVTSELFRLIDPHDLIMEMQQFLITSPIESDDKIAEMAGIDTQIEAGLVLCGFFYQSDEFARKMAEVFQRLDWNIYKKILDRQNALTSQALEENDKKTLFAIQRAKCFLSFQIAALHNFIDNCYEDSRAVGIKILTDLIEAGANSYLRSIVCDYIGRLVCMNPSFYDPFICMDAIELLARCMFEEKNPREIRGNTEKGCAAITLGFFVNRSSEARRRFFKMARKNENVMKSLKYSNKVIHPELMGEWSHFKDLNNTFSKELRYCKPKQSQQLKLPPIPNRNK